MLINWADLTFQMEEFEKVMGIIHSRVLNDEDKQFK